MNNTPLHPWIAVNGYMNRDFRETVVSEALGQLTHAEPGLRDFAQDALTSCIRVPGFRSVLTAPRSKAARCVAEEMQESPAVAQAIVALWADARRGLESQLEALLQAMGHQLPESWDWSHGVNGYISYDEIPILQALLDQVEAEFPEPERDHLALGILWISQSLASTTEPSDEPAISSDSQEGQREVTTTTEANDMARSQTVKTPDLEQPTEAVCTESDPKQALPVQLLGSESLDELATKVRKQVDDCDYERRQTIAVMENLLTCIKDVDTDQTAVRLPLASAQVKQWLEQSTLTQAYTNAVGKRVFDELARRPDLEADLADYDATGAVAHPQTGASLSAEDVLSTIELVEAYDAELKATRTQLDQVNGQVLQLQDDVAVWEPEAHRDSTATLPQHSDADGSLSLAAAKGSLQARKELRDTLSGRRDQLRQESSSKILALVSALEGDDGTEPITAVLPGLVLRDVKPDRLAELTDRELQKVERALQALAAQLAAKAETHELTALASSIRDELDLSQIEPLLQVLARDKRDVEVVLLLAAAASIGSLPDSLKLDADVIDGFLRGLALFSQEQGISRMLNLGASAFMTGWAADNPVSGAKLCLHMLAAKYAGPYELPGDFLWQLGAEWPLGNMPGWAHLWQCALLDDPLPMIIKDQDDDLVSSLQQTRHQASTLFVQEGGTYVRLHSLKSYRHSALMQDHFLPTLTQLWKSIADIDRAAERAEHYQFPQLQNRITNLIQERLEPQLDEDALVDSYDRHASIAGIDNKQPFHRRTTLRVLADYSEKLLAYAEAVERFVGAAVRQGSVLTRESLIDEIVSVGDLTPTASATVEKLINAGDASKPAWDAEEANQQIERHIVNTLLGQDASAYVLRLPNLVGQLTRRRLGWSWVLDPLLDDLATPIVPVEACEALLRLEAADQALLLAPQIPLDLQKTAQARRRELEREAHELERSLLSTGGSAEDLAQEHRLGRWRLWLDTVGEEVLLRQEQQEAENLKVQAAMRAAMAQINRTEMTFLDRIADVPVRQSEIVGRSLSLCRDIVRRGLPTPEVSGYLDDVIYRIEHDSWPEVDLLDWEARLEMAAQGELSLEGEERTVETVLHHLDRGELRPLGISEASLVDSEISTRVRLLQHWMAVRDLPAFETSKLIRPQQEEIRRLFTYFCRMNRLDHVLDPFGAQVTGDDPVYFAHWKLHYPKVKALNKSCVLIAMPGNPPTGQYLRVLEDVLEEREWLSTSWFYVLLLSPGMTRPQRDRLQSSYRNKGLVIIDEPAILQMVLAQAEDKKPLGVLRSMMLQAYGTMNVDIFKYEGTVDPVMAIFVGREPIVRRMSSSGDNYALYGGRRIGKSSVMRAIEARHDANKAIVLSDSFEGDVDCTDDGAARRWASKLQLEADVETAGDFKTAVQVWLDENPELELLVTLDEIDRYILANTDRHLLIETLRALCNQYSSRVRVIIAGFMPLYDCLRGRGPYSPSSDPWQRMLNDPGPLGNLTATGAEEIVKEGFIEILGWDFENRAIPQWIVQRTGGHPAFVQYFCHKLQAIVSKRGDRTVRLQDIEDVFADQDPSLSYIAYVRNTLGLNLSGSEGTIARYVILFLALESEDAQSFTYDQAREFASLSGAQIPEDALQRALESLTVTGIVDERSPGVFDFTVPDYPAVLNRLGDTALIDELETQLKDLYRE